MFRKWGEPQLETGLNGDATVESIYCLNFRLGIQILVQPKITKVRPRDTRPQAAWTLQVHVFELGPKKFELNKFM